METKKSASFADLIQSAEVVLVDFTASWCGPCKMMAPILEELKKQLGDSVRVIKIDIDKNPQLAEQYKVQSVPTLILFKSGLSVWRQAGVVPIGQLKDVVQRHKN